MKLSDAVQEVLKLAVERLSDVKEPEIEAPRLALEIVAKVQSSGLRLMPPRSEIQGILASAIATINSPIWDKMGKAVRVRLAAEIIAIHFIEPPQDTGAMYPGKSPVQCATDIMQYMAAYQAWLAARTAYMMCLGSSGGGGGEEGLAGLGNFAITLDDEGNSPSGPSPCGPLRQTMEAREAAMRSAYDQMNFSCGTFAGPDGPVTPDFSFR